MGNKRLRDTLSRFSVPPTLVISNQLVYATIGGTAELECLTAAHPPSLNFWTREDGEKYIIPE